ncbi:MAG: hypothetical protein ABI791_04700 [Acidobacteriota bacterium]
MADQKEFSGISREHVETIRKGLSKRGIKVPAGDDVEVAGPLGVKVQMTYDEGQKLLRLRIIDKPIFVTQNQIWKVIESGAGKALQQQ